MVYSIQGMQNIVLENCNPTSTGKTNIRETLLLLNVSTHLSSKKSHVEGVHQAVVQVSLCSQPQILAGEASVQTEGRGGTQAGQGWVQGGGLEELQVERGEIVKLVYTHSLSISNLNPTC